MPPARTIAYLATSIDGFMTGPDDDLYWLTEPRTSGLPVAGDAWVPREPCGLGFDELLARVGCLLTGRRTFGAVRAMDAPWPYGDLPAHVASHRPMEFDAASLWSATTGSVSAATGTIGDLIWGRPPNRRR